MRVLSLIFDRCCVGSKSIIPIIGKESGKSKLVLDHGISADIGFLRIDPLQVTLCDIALHHRFNGRKSLQVTDERGAAYDTVQDVDSGAISRSMYLFD